MESDLRHNNIRVMCVCTTRMTINIVVPFEMPISAGVISNKRLLIPIIWLFQCNFTISCIAFFWFKTLQWTCSPYKRINPRERYLMNIPTKGRLLKATTSINVGAMIEIISYSLCTQFYFDWPTNHNTDVFKRVSSLN